MKDKITNFIATVIITLIASILLILAGLTIPAIVVIGYIIDIINHIKIRIQLNKLIKEMDNEYNSK